ncbi:MAG: hypothetical protein KDB03_11440 [Planctomycetales bacterium]|nr:hypothetical protein [Planctomycetales bacterium]
MAQILKFTAPASGTAKLALGRTQFYFDGLLHLLLGGVDTSETAAEPITQGERKTTSSPTNDKTTPLAHRKREFFCDPLGNAGKLVIHTAFLDTRYQ